MFLGATVTAFVIAALGVGLFLLHNRTPYADCCGDCEIMWTLPILDYHGTRHSQSIPRHGTIVFCCDNFTDEIIFETEYATFARDVQMVWATMTNATAAPSYLDFSMSSFGFAKYIDGEWRLKPLYSTMGPYRMARLRTGESAQTIPIRADRDFGRRHFNVSLSPDFEFLPGRYRIIAGVELLPHKGEGMTHDEWLVEAERRRGADYPPEDIYFPDAHPTYHGTRHIVWAEFVVE